MSDCLLYCFVSVFRVLLSINSGKGVGKVHLSIIYTLNRALFCVLLTNKVLID